MLNVASKIDSPRSPSTTDSTAIASAETGTKWLWLIILPLAAVLRLMLLSHKSLSLDETVSVFIVRLRHSEFLDLLWHREGNMALYYAVLRPVVLYVSDSEFWVRLPAAVAGITAVPLMFALGKKIFDRGTAVLSALLICVSSCHVVYSQEARGYTLVVLFSILSWLLFFEGIADSSWKNWLLYALTSAVAVYSHFFAGLVLLAQWLSLALLPHRAVPWKELLVAGVLIGLLISPAVIVITHHDIGQLGWVQKPDALELYHTAVFLAGESGRAVGKFLLVFCVIALVQAAHVLWRRFPTETPMVRWRLASLWIWLLSPMFLSYLFSHLRAPIFVHRYFIICLPPFLLLVAQGLGALRGRMTVVTAFVALSLASTFVSYSRPREDWRSAASFVMSHSQPGDAIAFDGEYGRMAFAYYERHILSGSTAPFSVSLDDSSQLQGMARLWVVFYPISPRAPADPPTQEQMTAKYPVLQQASFRALRIVLFDLRSQSGLRPR